MTIRAQQTIQVTKRKFTTWRALRSLAGPTRVDDIDPYLFAIDAENPTDQARDVHRISGLWPISFSWPGRLPAIEVLQPKERLLAPQVPGAGYTYLSEDDYYSDYSRSLLALTWRKGGWDCFRHIEIMAAASLPLMPDAPRIPRETMAFYPKALLTLIMKRVLAGRYPPAEVTRVLLQYVGRHLVSSEMSRYLIDATRSDPSDVLFLDPLLPSQPDYLSIMTLVGLLDVTRVSVAAFPKYLGSAEEGAQTLYGLGFGYAGVAAMRPKPFVYGSLIEAIDAARDHDLVVVGSAHRSPELICQLVRVGVKPERLVLVDGGDTTPTPSQVDFYRSAAHHVFVRELAC